MHAKVVMCNLCRQMTEEGESIDGKSPFIIGFDEKIKKLTNDIAGVTKHLCQECISGIKDGCDDPKPT